MAQLTDILVRTMLPLHPRLIAISRLSIQLIGRGIFLEETQAETRDNHGVWEANSTLKLPDGDQPLTLAIVIDGPNKKIRLVSSTFNSGSFFSKAITQSNECHEITAYNSVTQTRVIISCHFKAELSTSSALPAGGRFPTLIENKPYSSPKDPMAVHRKDLEQVYSTCTSLPNSDEKTTTLSAIGARYYALYQQSNDAADLDSLISIRKEAIDGGQSHPQCALLLEHLSDALEMRYDYSGNRADVDDAIQASQNALSLIQGDAPERARLLMGLASKHSTRFMRLGDPADTNLAVTYIEVVALMPEGSLDKVLIHNNLSGALLRRFSCLGALEDLDKALANMKIAMSLTPDGHPSKPSRHSNLGIAFQIRFQRLGDLADLDRAISNHENAVTLLPDGHPNKPSFYNNIGIALRYRFERLGNLSDLERAIYNNQTAIDLTPNGHPNKSSCYNNLGNALQQRFERLGGPADLESAIAYMENAVNLTPDGHPEKPSWYKDLGNALQCRFKRLNDLADLDRAIFNHENAVTLVPDGHPDRPSFYNSLGSALRYRFEHIGDLADLEKAVTNTEKAMALIPDGHPNKPILHNILGKAFQARFERLGDLADLERAILNNENAVDLTPDGHPRKPSWYGNLGNTLQRRFERLGGLADLESAITNMENAVNLTPDGHPEKPSWYNNLGVALQTHFERLGDLTGLERAISKYENAINLTPDGHSDRPLYYSNLGNALQYRFERLDNPTDLERAISNNENAVKLTSDENPSKPWRYGKLGHALQSRFRCLGDLADLERAIFNHKNAVNLRPEGHPYTVTENSNLAYCHEVRFSQLAEDMDLDSACSLYASAAQSHVGYPQPRFEAAISWSRCMKLKNIPPLPAFRHAIDQLSRIAWLGIPVSEQHSSLEEIGGAVRDAVAAAVSAEEYSKAVEWTEQGRSIVWQNLLKLRTPVDDLRAVHPKLATQLQSISQQLDLPTSHELQPKAREGKQPQKSHTSLAIEWDQTVEEIRKVPHFESFLKPKGFNSLSPAAREGPVVIINVAQDRCDALVLVQDGEGVTSIVPIRLGNFSLEKGTTLLENLTNLLEFARVRHSDTRTANRRPARAGKTGVSKILLALWLDVVKPVIEGLGYQPQAKNLPRIWWCATGPLAFLPIHAAGNYDATEIGEKLSDYAVSSYTPTLSAILDSSYAVPSKNFQILAIAQPYAPNQKEIPKTMDEIAQIVKIADGVSVLSLMKEEATVERVQQGMRESNWVHLACHGKQDTLKSIESGLILYDGTLKLSTIIKEPLPKADFAFLSACQTAMGDQRLAEESAHLAAGMLLAGYKGVIATMWSIKDDDAPKVAEGVYSRILKDGKPDRREAAYALHEAVRELRESGADFLSWVPFIHIGR